MKIFIEPNDILMFRDGRPFAGGDDHFARGTFPPSPSTIYGSLRSHILSTNWPEYNKFASHPDQIPENIKKEIGTPECTGSLTISQLSIAKRDKNDIEQFFPIPTDVVQNKGDETKVTYVLSPENMSNSKIMSNLPKGLNNIWYHSEEILESVSGFLSSQEMEKYLLGNAPSIYVESKKLFKTEERTGIRKNRIMRSVETGGIYSVEYFRMNKETGFAVEVENTELLPLSGILRLGGDNRSANYSQTSWNEIDSNELKKKIENSKHFKLVLTTPAIFKKGWLPENIDSAKMEGKIKGISVKMISACIGKPLGIGGYDFVKNRPKIMQKAVPAGSVYYFSLLENDVDRLFDQVWLKSISDERSQEGFGITLIGGF